MLEIKLQARHRSKKKSLLCRQILQLRKYHFSDKMTRRKQDKLIQYVYKLYHQQKNEHLTETNTNTTHKTREQ